MTFPALEAATLLLACSLGGMIYFGAAVAPVIFTTLEEAEAARLIRRLFSVYFLAHAGLTALALTIVVAAGLLAPPGLIALGLVVAWFVYARFNLMHAINASRDAASAGDASAAQRFKRLHQTSVAVNFLQILAVAYALIALLRS